jgi:hypothetical protein
MEIRHHLAPNLTAAIMGAIIAYIQMEPKSPQVAARVKPEPKPVGGKFPDDGSK